MLCRFGALIALAFFAGLGPAAAADCAANPGALGTSRVLVIDPAEHRKLGALQYDETLPLEDHEIVLTFDDGPLAPFTSRVLDALAAECVKATFFVVGQMAASAPGLVQRAYREGHTIGTHTQHHAHLDRIPLETARKEITDGIASAAKALGNVNALAPFFRVPYLDPTNAVEDYALKQGLTIWSVDFFVNDWKNITVEQTLASAIDKVERKKKGIMLLHDIHERTAAALPTFLRELKKRGYRIVHVVPASRDHAKTETKSGQWAAAH